MSNVGFGMDDRERVRELLGREPQGKFQVVVRDAVGDPVVLLNEPLLDDGTPLYLLQPLGNLLPRPVYIGLIIKYDSNH